MKRSFQTRASAIVLFGLLNSSIALGISGVGIPAAQAQSVPDEVGRGYNLLELGWVDDAIDAFEEAIDLYPRSVPAQLGLAIALRRAGQDDEAFAAYDRVLELDPTNSLALKTLGLLGTYRPEWQNRGIEALTVFLDSTPEDTEARALRALLYGYQSRIAEARADYQILLQAPNPTSDVLLGAAQIYVYSGDSRQGLELFDRYRQTGGAITGYAAIAYARALRENGNPAAGIPVLEAQLAALPGNNPAATEARAELARSYLATEQPEQALAALQPLRGQSDATLTLARGLGEIGRQTDRLPLLQESAVLYRQVLSQTPNPPIPLLQEAADVLASIPGEEELALQLYRQLAAAQPDNRVLAVQQLAFESQLGQIAQPDLRSRLGTVLEPLPSNPQDLDRIAGALSRIDPPDPQLLPIYQSLIAAGVDRPFLNFRIAQMFLQLNDSTAARQALDAYIAGIDGRPDPASDIILADIERREGNLEASEQRYQLLLAEYADDSNLVEAALQGLIGVRLAQNRPGEAIDLYDQLIARRPEDLTLQLGRTSLAYQEELITQTDAEAVLQNWLTTQPATATPPELYSLVGALPADPSREALYNRLIEVDPYYMPLQFRSIQVLALRDP
ncbi:MAG: tetratricopeptide repeat protein, partial [Geitlerinemataceae cyanobacterium]